jgi:ABC-2 type transport system permease protein
MAFSNLNSNEKFSQIKIGIVNNEEYNRNTDFVKVIESHSKGAGKDNLFDIKYTSKDDADKLLIDNKIDGYVYFDNGMKLVVKKSGLNQTIIKSFLDDYKQTSSTVVTIINKNPAAVQNGLIDSVSDRKNYLKEVSAGKAAPDTTVNYFYTLIAMACIAITSLSPQKLPYIQAIAINV